MQVEAERKKRAAILESEGVREAEINVAEGKKRAQVLASGETHAILLDILIRSFSNIFNKIVVEFIQQRRRKSNKSIWLRPVPWD